MTHDDVSVRLQPKYAPNLSTGGFDLIAKQILGVFTQVLLLIDHIFSIDVSGFTLQFSVSNMHEQSLAFGLDGMVVGMFMSLFNWTKVSISLRTVMLWHGESVLDGGL
jgi:hypothetical protein